MLPITRLCRRAALRHPSIVLCLTTTHKMPYKLMQPVPTIKARLWEEGQPLVHVHCRELGHDVIPSHRTRSLKFLFCLGLKTHAISFQIQERPECDHPATLVRRVAGRFPTFANGGRRPCDVHQVVGVCGVLLPEEISTVSCYSPAIRAVQEATTKIQEHQDVCTGRDRLKSRRPKWLRYAKPDLRHLDSVAALRGAEESLFYLVGITRSVGDDHDRAGFKNTLQGVRRPFGRTRPCRPCCEEQGQHDPRDQGRQPQVSTRPTAT